MFSAHHSVLRAIKPAKLSCGITHCKHRSHLIHFVWPCGEQVSRNWHKNYILSHSCGMSDRLSSCVPSCQQPWNVAAWLVYHQVGKSHTLCSFWQLSPHLFSFIISCWYPMPHRHIPKQKTQPKQKRKGRNCVRLYTNKTHRRIQIIYG